MMGYSIIPATLMALSVLVIASYWIIADLPKSSVSKWISFAFVFAGLVAQIIVAAVNPMIFMHGGLVNDGITQSLSILVFIGTAFYLINERNDKKRGGFFFILALATAYFSIFAVQSNSLLFTWIALFGFLLGAFGLLNIEGELWKKKLMHNIAFLRKLALFLFVSTLILAICLMIFDHVQIDEIHLSLIKKRIHSDYLVLAQAILLAIPILLVGGIPLLNLLGKARDTASWSTIMFVTSQIFLIAAHIFLKEGLFVFTRVGVGTKELEELLGQSPFLIAKIASSVGIILIPLCALYTKNVRQGVQLLICEGILISFFAMSFGEKTTMAFGVGNLVSVLGLLMLLGMSYKELSSASHIEIKYWLGFGRREPFRAILFLSAIWGLAGYPPFFQNKVIQKVLSAANPLTSVVAIGYFLSGLYALRLSVLAFQGEGRTQEKSGDLSLTKDFFAVGLFFLLIFMGIFWQPLYKYGAYNIRHLFGEF